MIDPQLRDNSSVLINNRTLRQFAGLWILFFGGLVCWDGLVREHQTRALLWAILAATIGPLGLVVPQAIKPVFVVLMAITIPIGWVVSHVIIAFLFYGVFTPVALFFKLIGRDVLARRIEPDLDTYWAPKPIASDMQSYLRQS